MSALRMKLVHLSFIAAALLCLLQGHPVHAFALKAFNILTPSNCQKVKAHVLESKERSRCNLIMSAERNLGVQPVSSSSRRKFITACGIISACAFNGAERVSMIGSVASPKSAFAAELQSDEIEVCLNVQDSVSLGLELDELFYKQVFRVSIKNIIPGGLAAKERKLKYGQILVSVNDQSLEGFAGRTVKQKIVESLANSKAEGKPLCLVVRDSSAFTDALRPSIDGEPQSKKEITTAITPKRTRAPAQVVKVEKTYIPELCTVGAEFGDLVEIEYTGRLEDGRIFDGSKVGVGGRTVPGRGGDATLYFVLGKQPAGQFPPGWDVGLVGMCVGEKRVISIPPALGFGEQGLQRRGIPSDATLFYDINLVSINGLAIPK